MRRLWVLGVIAVVAVVVIRVGWGASPPRQSDAVPFARNFVLTVFPRGASCTTIARYSRDASNNCASVNRLSHYFLTKPDPTSVKKCTGVLADGTVASEQCVEFQAIAHAASDSGWSLGTLHLDVGKDSHGHLVIDSVTFNGGDCLAGKTPCRRIWNSRVIS